MMRKSLRASVLALLLVLSAVSAGGAAPAAASHNCNKLDFALAFMEPSLNERCYNIHMSHTVQEMEAVDAEQTRMDTHQGALDELAKMKNMNTRVDNYLQDTEGAAWSKAEIAVAKAWENGSTKAATRSGAKSAVQDYYSVKAKNYVSDLNTMMAAHKKMENTTDMEDNVSESFHHVNTSLGDRINQVEIQGWTTETYELPNGSSVDVTAVQLQVHGRDKSYSMTYDPLDGTQTHSPDGMIGHDTTVYGWQVKPPNDGYEPVYTNFKSFESRWSEIHSQSSALTAEAVNYSVAVYDGLESGKINSTEVINRNTAMFDMAAGEVEGENSLYRSTVAFGMMGYDHPNLNNSGVMEISYNGQTYEGLLLAEQAPGSSWQAGTTYNASNVTGPVMLVSTSGDYLRMSGEFSVGNITNKRGENIESVNHTETTYKTSNVTELLEKLEQIQAARQEAEEREDRIIVRDGGGAGGNLPLVAAVAVLALIVVAMVTKR